MCVFHRNLSHVRRTPKVGPYSDLSSSSYIEDSEGRPKTTQGGGDVSSSSGPTSQTGGPGGGVVVEKNRNCINYERQQQQQLLQPRLPSPESSGASLSTTTTGLTLTPLSEPPAMATPGALHHLHSHQPPHHHCAVLTQEDLETPKLDPSEVERNLRESSDESLMETSQKQFCAPDTLASGPHSLLYPLIKMAAEVTGGSSSALSSHHHHHHHSDGTQSSGAAHPLPKQQNLPKRPSSLPLHAKTSGKDSSSSSSSLRLKFGKQSKSNLRQVETGVAKANTVVVAAEPRLVTVANNVPVTDAVAGASGGGGVGSSNSGGASGHHGKGPASSEDLSFGLLAASPDEQEPLLRREARPNNANNNNSNNNNGESEGEGENEGGSESADNAVPPTEAPTTTNTGTNTNSSLDAPPGSSRSFQERGESATPPQPRMEALLRQHKGRRPERPNSLDLSVTTLTSTSENRATQHPPTCL